MRQSGLIQIFVVVILLLGILAGTYLVLEGPKIFEPKAASPTAKDLSETGLNSSFNSRLGDPNYNPNYDSNLDGVINGIDAVQVRTLILAGHQNPNTEYATRAHPPDNLISQMNWMDQSLKIGSGNGIFAMPQGGNTQKLEEDVLITGIIMGIRDIPKGAVFDVCVNVSRSQEPKYPGTTGGFTEVLCWYVARHATSNNWDMQIDLTNTPIFLPKNTDTICATTGYNLTSQTAPQVKFNCHLVYKKYHSGDKRFRTFRFPYIDQSAIFISKGITDIPVTYYIPSSIFPINIRAVSAYYSFGGSDQPDSAKPCLRLLHQGGKLVDEFCLPVQSIAPGQDYESPQPYLLDWKVTDPVKEVLGANCVGTRPNTDCAIWAIVEIPQNLEESPENLVRDYNNVAPSYLQHYCNQYVSYFNHPYFCDGQQSCNNQTKTARCMELFPPASCLQTDSCSK